MAATVNVRSCGGPVGPDHVVRHLAALPRELLLQLGLVVDVARRRVLDAAAEGADDRRLDRGEPVLEEERGQRGLEQRRAHVAVLGQTLHLLLGDALRMLEEELLQAELVGDDRAALARDDVRAQPGQLALGEVRIRVVQGARDRELEHAVAEEFESLVRVAPVGRPGRMREHLAAARSRELGDQPAELGAVGATGATRRSRPLGQPSGSAGHPRPRS